MPEKLKTSVIKVCVVQGKCGHYRALCVIEWHDGQVTEYRSDECLDTEAEALEVAKEQAHSIARYLASDTGRIETVMAQPGSAAIH